MIRRQMTLSEHDGITRPASKLHQFVECSGVAYGSRSERVAQRVPMQRADSSPLYGALKGFGVAVVDRLAVILKDTTAIRRELGAADPFARLQGLEPSLCVERLESPEHID